MITHDPTKDSDPRNPIFTCGRQIAHREGAALVPVNGDPTCPSPEFWSLKMTGTCRLWYGKPWKVTA